MVKVSVLMPIYRTKEEYLRQAIESILNQTFDDFEFLIIDDNPDDNREEIVKSYDDKRIKYFKNEKNLGITPTRNLLNKIAKGEYLAIMDHDDISLPQRFEKQVKYLDEHPDVGVVGCNIHKIVANKTIKQPIENEDIKIALMMKCVITHPASMIRAKVLKDNDIKYEEKYSPAEDYALWCRLIPFTNFYNIDEVLFNYRDHKENTTSKTHSKMEKSTFDIWAENKIKYPELWQKFNSTKALFLSTIRLFGFIPLLKIKKSGRRKQILLFDFILLLNIKNSIKV